MNSHELLLSLLFVFLSYTLINMFYPWPTGHGLPIRQWCQANQRLGRLESALLALKPQIEARTTRHKSASRVGDSKVWYSFLVRNTSYKY